MQSLSSAKAGRPALLVFVQPKCPCSGGITGSRGHSGDNPGSEAIAALLLKQTFAATATAVFGGPLFEPGACADGVVCEVRK